MRKSPLTIIDNCRPGALWGPNSETDGSIKELQVSVPMSAFCRIQSDGLMVSEVSYIDKIEIKST